MIPKIIHYCWLSTDPIPENLQEYLGIWKEKLKDYEFMLWNFDRFDINSSAWVRESFENKKYAFTADFIRLHAIYNYGGVYMDLDVEMLTTFNSFTELRTMIGFEKEGHEGDRLEVGVFGAEKKSSWIKSCLSYYENRPFKNKKGELDTKILPLVVKDILLENEYKLIRVSTISEALEVTGEFTIPVFGSEYFSPKSHSTGKVIVTSNAVCVHHFAGSWLPLVARTEIKLFRFLGIRNRYLFHRLYNIITDYLRGTGPLK